MQKIYQVSSNWWLTCVTVRLRVKDGIHVIIVNLWMFFWMSKLPLCLCSTNKILYRNICYNGLVHLITATAKRLTFLPSSHWHGNFTSTSSSYNSLSRFTSAENDAINGCAAQVIIKRCGKYKSMHAKKFKKWKFLLKNYQEVFAKNFAPLKIFCNILVVITVILGSMSTYSRY